MAQVEERLTSKHKALVQPTATPKKKKKIKMKRKTNLSVSRKEGPLWLWEGRLGGFEREARTCELPQPPFPEPQLVGFSLRPIIIHP
jgi:hypothetical protein